jgi:hypothetical protein
MAANQKYFTIPFEDVPANPSYTVWFATWSRERPLLEPGMNPPLVVGVTSDSTLPAGAFLLGGGSKDPQPPPPPPPPMSFNPSDYQRSVSEWLEVGRDADE